MTEDFTDEIEMSESDQHHSRASYRVDNYHTVEIVAVPPDFDIVNYLSIREQAGIFKQKHVNTKHIQIIAEGVRSSPVFAMMNNTHISPVTCMFFIKIMKELGLILKSIHNPLRKDLDVYMKRVDENPSSYLYVAGQEIKRINFTIINIFPMMSQEVLDEAVDSAKNLQVYQKEVNEKLKTLTAK